MMVVIATMIPFCRCGAGIPMAEDDSRAQYRLDCKITLRMYVMQ
jgi:hypothetical protein